MFCFIAVVGCLIVLGTFARCGVRFGSLCFAFVWVLCFGLGVVCDKFCCLVLVFVFGFVVSARLHLCCWVVSVLLLFVLWMWIWCGLLIALLGYGLAFIVFGLDV